MFGGKYDPFDLNRDGKLDGLELAIAYTVLFGDEEAKENEDNDDNMDVFFEQSILEHLKESSDRYPAMEQQDAVKFVFQAMLGVGHLLSSRETVENYIARELNGLIPDSDEPLLEPLSPQWARLNLRRALSEGIQPSVIAEYMFASQPAVHFSRQEVFDFCMRIAKSGNPLFDNKTTLHRILEPTWLPSHSHTYRELYHPAYRVISPDSIMR